MGEKFQKFIKFVGRQEEGVRSFREKKFEKEKLGLERRAELEEIRAKSRASEAKVRPRGGGGFLQQAFGQTSGPQAPPRGVVRRKIPRRAARGRVLFDQFGRPVSVRNAPSIRRAKKRRQRAVPQQSPFAPSFRF